MTELRDRIAEVMFNKYESNFVRGASFAHTWQMLLDEIEHAQPDRVEFNAMNIEIRDEWLSIADAVIQDLGLQESVRDGDDGSGWAFTGPGGEVTSGFRAPTQYRRYISREEALPRDDV